MVLDSVMDFVSNLKTEWSKFLSRFKARGTIRTLRSVVTRPDDQPFEMNREKRLEMARKGHVHTWFQPD